MNVIIIEDEKPAARRLQRMLKRLDMDVQTMLHSVVEATTWFQNNTHPDLIFLDIQLSDGLSFEIFENVTVKSSIIFTTAYDEYALQAFKLNSIDYLLKPIDEDELIIAVNKYKNFKPQPKNIVASFQEIKNILMGENAVKQKTRFTIKVGQHLKIINISEISCFYSEHKATFLVTNSGRNYPIDETLEQLEGVLNDKIFYRISRKYFVNIDTIADIVMYSNSRLKLKIKNFDDQNIIVSRDRVKGFKQWLL